MPEMSDLGNKWISCSLHVDDDNSLVENESTEKINSEIPSFDVRHALLQGGGWQPEILLADFHLGRLRELLLIAVEGSIFF
jgi:hypothetical protein